MFPFCKKLEENQGMIVEGAAKLGKSITELYGSCSPSDCPPD